MRIGEPQRRNPMSEARVLLGIAGKKLWRLLHVFSHMLELSFRSNANMAVDEPSTASTLWQRPMKLAT
ncbi:hypothetical protein E2542_SST07062 [Spatholobus suberectus]|nr:hypothetical protein E2542_SST07062 [Spatholobus suberectus]